MRKLFIINKTEKIGSGKRKEGSEGDEMREGVTLNVKKKIL